MEDIQDKEGESLTWEESIDFCKCIISCIIPYSQTILCRQRCHFRKHHDFVIHSTHLHGPGSVLHNMCRPGSGKLGSHFSWRAGVGSSFVLSCSGGKEPRYSCHRRVWFPQGGMSEDDAKWHFSCHSDHLRRYPLDSSWPGSGSGDAGGAALLSRLRPELLRIWELENLRAQSHPNFQSRNTRPPFVSPFATVLWHKY